MSNAFAEFKALKIKNLNNIFNYNVNNLIKNYNNSLSSTRRSRNTNINKNNVANS